MTVEQLIVSIASNYADCMKEALEEARKNIKNDSWDLGTLVKNATWSAYCEGLEQALMIVNDCTAAGLKELAAKRASQAKPGDAQAPTDQ
jgi:hypothetical protein